MPRVYPHWADDYEGWLSQFDLFERDKPPIDPAIKWTNGRGRQRENAPNALSRVRPSEVGSIPDREMGSARK